MRVYPLNATQEDMLQAADPLTLETAYSITRYIEIPVKVLSLEGLSQACQTVLSRLAYTHSHLILQDGRVMICEDETMPNHVWVHRMTDQQWTEGKEQIVRPFSMLKEPCVRMHAIGTETKTVMCFEYNHLFFDGISIKGLLNAVEDVLAGNSPEDQGDITAVWNEAEVASYGNDAYLRARQVTCDKFRGHPYTDICRQTEHPYGTTLYACYLLGYDRMKHIRLNSGALSEDQQHSMMTTICVAAYALALGQMAGTTEVVFMTTNHGRIDKRLNAKVLGNFLKSMSLRINTAPRQSVAELLAQTRTALFGMMRTIGYPWTHMVRDLQLTPAEQAGTEMNVSGSGIYEYITIKGCDYPAYRIETPKSDIHLFLVVQIREEGLTFNVEGSEALYTQVQLDTMARLTGEYALQLIGDQSKKLKELLIDHEIET